MSWSVVAGVLAVGLAVLVVAATTDRRSRDHVRRLQTGVPDRPVPGLDPQAGTPVYVHDDELQTAGPAEIPDAVTRLRATAGLAGRLCAADDRTEVWARDVLVLCTPDVPQFRALVSPVGRARRLDRGLVVICRTIDEDSLATLIANERRRLLPGFVAQVDSDDDLEAVAQACGAVVVSQADLVSGWLPTQALGTCAWAAADHDGLWLEQA